MWCVIKNLSLRVCLRGLLCDGVWFGLFFLGGRALSMMCWVVLLHGVACLLLLFFLVRYVSWRENWMKRILYGLFVL